MDAKIVVGTSAIEVGIDFDTEALIFEATDSASFIQRLGRVARKRRGRALCITPYYNYGKLQENLPSGGEVAYSQLENAVAKAYPRNPSYVHLFKTPYGAVAQMGITHALTHRLCRVKEKSILRRLKRLLKFSEELSPPPPMVWLKTFQSLLEGDHRKLRKTLAENSDLAKLFKVLGYKGQAVHALERLIAIAESFEKMGVRGPYSSLPAYVVLKRNGEGIYEALTSVSITDLEKLDFAYVRNCEEFEEEVGHRPSIDIEFPILIVRGISRRKNRIRIGISRFFEGEIFTLRKCEMQVISGDNELDSKISCILNGLPAYITTGRPADWRFTALRLNTKAEKWLVIGPDSIIQAWIDAERGEL